ncbi:MAG: preprotein translocase subunit SecY [Parcubacteria group bacterium]|nr:preprotein translocase subunit SecY [Parcubacteria group bacterium]
MALANTIKHIWKSIDLRNGLLYILALLVIFRIVAHIPLPGIDLSVMRQLFQSSSLLGFIDLLSGGGIRNFSIAAMGVAPYITASIIVQLLTMVVPSLEELSKEGEQGHNKINQYTRLLTIPIAALQAVGLLALLKNTSQGLITEIPTVDYLTAIISLVAGTVFLMWLGELISQKNLGNGVSLLIFAGIVAQLPQMIGNTLFAFEGMGSWLDLILFGLIALVTLFVVVFITEGHRNIPVSYARMVRGGSTSGGAHTYLPLKVNQAGVIPIIFAISIVTFPPFVAQLFLSAKSAFLASMAQWVITLFNNASFNSIFYFILVFGFTYFYTAIVFQPEKVAENLQKQGGFIPGIRPGKPTADYLDFVSARIMLAGAVFLGAIAVLPMTVQQFTGVTTIGVGGTSLLIVVSVVLETVRQIQSQLTMREYEDVVR